jgi:hypothetical protein
MGYAQHSSKQEASMMDWLVALQGASMICGGIGLVVTLAVGWLLIKGVKSLAESEESEESPAAEGGEGGESE